MYTRVFNFERIFLIEKWNVININKNFYQLLNLTRNTNDSSFMLTLSIYPKARKLFKNQRVTLVKTSKILTTRTKPSFHHFSIRFFLQKKKRPLFSSTKTRIPFSLNPKSEIKEANSRMFHRVKILRREKFSDKWWV